MRNPSDIFPDTSHQEWAAYILFRLNNETDTEGDGFTIKYICRAYRAPHYAVRRAMEILERNGEVRGGYYCRKVYRYAPIGYSVTTSPLTKKQTRVYEFIKFNIDRGINDISFRELANGANVSKGAICQIVDALEKKCRIAVNRLGSESGTHKNQYQLWPKSQWR